MTDSASSQLRERINFYRLKPNDPSFAEILTVLDKCSDDALNQFYKNVEATPETARFFVNRAAMDRAHKAQVQHWKKAFQGGLGEDYFAATKKVGDVHSRIGLEPKWYIGGYANILEHILTSIMTTGMGFFSRRRKSQAHMISTLIKVALMDMDIAITRYFEVEEERRRNVIATIGRALRDVSEGDLSVKMPKLPADYAQIEQDFDHALNRLRESFAEILGGSGQIASSASEIRAATDDLARRSEQQAANLEESAAAMEELTGVIVATNNAMGNLNTSVTRTHDSARGGETVVQQAISAMDKIEHSSTEISKVISIIDDIAFQTNLLALNAGVEAARVGEHGRGFAVVANEVRALAQNSASAAEQIKNLIKNSVREVEHGVRLVNDVGRALSTILTEVRETSTVAEQITEASSTQSMNLRQINAVISEMSEATQHNAAMVEQNNAAVHSLEEEAGRVASAARQFKVKSKGTPTRKAA